MSAYDKTLSILLYKEFPMLYSVNQFVKKGKNEYYYFGYARFDENKCFTKEEMRAAILRIFSCMVRGDTFTAEQYFSALVCRNFGLFSHISHFEKTVVDTKNIPNIEEEYSSDVVASVFSTLYRKFYVDVEREGLITVQKGGKSIIIDMDALCLMGFYQTLYTAIFDESRDCKYDPIYDDFNSYNDRVRDFSFVIDLEITNIVKVYSQNPNEKPDTILKLADEMVENDIIENSCELCHNCYDVNGMTEEDVSHFCKDM